MSELINTSNEELTTVNTFASSAGIDFWREALSDDCAGLEFQLDNIKIPAGGATMFELPGENEDTEMVKEINGVILFHHPAFAYYKDKYTGGNNPPDCGSYDGIVGVGTPGGDCSNCPLNQFGSADDGVSKACKNKRNIYILIEGELLPMMLSLPTGSLKEFTKYVKRQLSKGRRLNQVVTKITLKKATSNSGIAFSQAVFTFVRDLNGAEKANIIIMSDQVKEYSKNAAAAQAASKKPNIDIDYDTGEVIEPLT